MALIGRASEHGWDSTADARERSSVRRIPTGDDQVFDEVDEVAPTTSRSPSFVRAVAPRNPDETLESLVTIAEPKVRPIVVDEAPAPASERLPSYGELEVALRVEALRAEEACDAVDSRYASAVRTIVAEASAMGEAARALLPRARELDGLLRHAYEWSTNVLRRSSGALEGDELSVAEYSSLFVRAILHPMIDAALEGRRVARDTDSVSKLASLREAVVWLNWAAGRLG
jgi:hypothetical protein